MRPRPGLRRIARSFVLEQRRRLRRLTAARRALPDFLVIGAQRSGTTSLYGMLTTHPRIVPALAKEIHYFDWHHRRGEAWYRANFPLRSQLRGDGGERLLTGEATPHYMFHAPAMRRLAALVPEARLIVLLRNPVDRAISHYYHEVRAGLESRPMEEAFEADRSRIQGGGATGEDARLQHHSYLGRGLYAEQLERVLSLYPEEQLLVVRSEDLYADPVAGYHRVLGYLDLPPAPLPDRRARNVGSYPEPPEEVRAELATFFEPPNQRLYGLIGRRFDW